MRTFLLMALSAGKEDETLERLREHFHVVESHRLYGTYDAIAIVEVNDINELSETINGLLNDGSGILYVETLMERGEGDGS
ncbi:Lrp/AsnC ligand binding domain-containing protein [Palaeococcus ferrophilus]|uniref:Lrp/AsnC ligand binding domain-containing protein n=1 Tax=Palaeococcus ferrophilus TaxID=83868 RepID=UPI00064F7D0B|nr:Lrp/AsnC ligand binding domain-containing protein [Palaeococcus ferrophilus]